MPEETKLPTNSETSNGDAENTLANLPDPGQDYPTDEYPAMATPDFTQSPEESSQFVIERLIKRLHQLLECYATRMTSLETYLKIVAECQKEMSKFANNLFESHTLYPAIETVDLVTSLIQQLHEQAGSIVENQTHCPLFKSLIDSIANAAKSAQAKREYLDIETICPHELDELDSDKHDIRQVVQTNDADSTGKSNEH